MRVWLWDCVIVMFEEMNNFCFYRMFKKFDGELIRLQSFIANRSGRRVSATGCSKHAQLCISQQL
jgi:hypothetical protein